MDANDEMVHSHSFSPSTSVDGADCGETADPSEGGLSSSIHSEISEVLSNEC